MGPGRSNFLFVQGSTVHAYSHKCLKETTCTELKEVINDYKNGCQLIFVELSSVKEGITIIMIMLFSNL